MAVGKITISSVGKLKGWLWDQTVSGFGARRQTQGVFYYVRYRQNGSQVVRSIGRHGHWTPETARIEARRLLGAVLQAALIPLLMSDRLRGRPLALAQSAILNGPAQG